MGKRALLHTRRQTLQRIAALACNAGVLSSGALTAADALAQSSNRRPWPSGRPTPDFRLADMQGTEWQLSQLRGQVVLLNFWASWCEPCRSEMPSLELLAQRHERDGLVVLAINFRETDRAIQRFLAQYPLTLPVVRDRDGAVAKAWEVRVFPSTILIDRTGLARYTVQGEVDWTGSPARTWVNELVA